VGRRRAKPILLVLAFVVALPAVVAAQSSDAFLCYKTVRPKGDPKYLGTTVAVSDEWIDASLDLRPPKLLCVPVDIGGGIADSATHLRAYKSRTTRGTIKLAAETDVHTANLVGDLIVDRKANPKLLLVPSAVDASASPLPPAPGTHALDHYRCQKATSLENFPSGVELTVSDALSGARTLRLIKPHHLCAPVTTQGFDIADPANQLLCYIVRRQKGAPKHVPVEGLHTADQFHSAALDTVREHELCLPTRSIGSCNRFGVLCDREFDAIAHPTTHNAMSNAEEGWLGPNQSYSITRQLEEGIRAQMLDTWYFGGDPVLCHGGDVVPCDFAGMKPLADGLAEIKAFLDRHPNEVTSIIFESYISEIDTQTAFFDSGLIQYVHVQSSAAPWPTLRQLIEADTRLIVFTDDSSASLPWHHYVWDHAWETHFSFQAPEDFSCSRNRGSMSNSLFILNHFLTQVIGSPALAGMVNHNPLLIDRAQQCQSESGRLPNFVTVDFYDIGDLFPAVDELNGIPSL
jgi:hypothetical protein